MNRKLKNTLLISALALLLIVMAKKGDKIQQEVLEAATGAFRSFLNMVGMPRGIRNNNPGNLVRTSIGWKYKIPHNESQDNTFEQFQHLPGGIRAMMKDLKSDINKGQNTLRKLIKGTLQKNYEDAYSQTDQDAYLYNVGNWTAYGYDQVLGTDTPTISKLVKAFSRMENGGNYLTDIDINQASTLL